MKISFKLLNEQRRTKCLQTCKIDLISDSYVPLDCLFLVCYSWWVDLSHKGLISSDFLEVLLRVEACVYTPAGIGRNYFEKYHFFSFKNISVLVMIGYDVDNFSINIELYLLYMIYIKCIWTLNVNLTVPSSVTIQLRNFWWSRKVQPDTALQVDLSWKFSFIMPPCKRQTW